MDSLNQIIFDDKSFSDLLKEIHKNQSKKSKQLASLIAELRPLITSLGDATVVVPLIKEYMEISVKNRRRNGTTSKCSRRNIKNS